MEKGRMVEIIVIIALILLPLKVLNVGEVVERASAAVTSIAPEVIYPVRDAADVWITAYASVPEETKDYGSPFITASNKHVEDGFVAANFLPFGTKIRIPDLFGDKIFTVEDRMSERRTNFVDIWMPTVVDAVNFGIHHAEIVILGDAISGHIAER